MPIRPATRLLPLLLVAALVAGCLSSTSPPPAPKGWRVDCGLGAHERNLGPGHDWAQDCLARASHTPGHKQEIWLAVNPLDAKNVIVGAKDLDGAISADCVWNGIFVTHDGGVSWKDVYISGKYADRYGTPYYGYGCNTDPMGVFTADGTAHWVIEMYNLGSQNGGFGPAGADPSSGRGIMQPGWKLLLAHSHDGGDTWPVGEVTTLEYGDGVGLLNDYSRIATNPVTGSVITAINTYYPALGANTSPLPVQPPIYPGGVVCSVLAYRGQGSPGHDVVPVQPVIVTSKGNPGGLNCNGIASAHNGTLTIGAIGTSSPLAGTQAAPNATLHAWFANSADDGKSWTDFTPGFDLQPIPGKFNESAYRTGTNFEMAYDQTGGAHAGNLYVIYAADAGDADGARTGTDADIYVRSSADNGHSWGDATRVNLNTTGHQFEPNIAVAADGSLHAFFMDKQYDDQEHTTATGAKCMAHCFIDITYARSDDGGKSWSNRRITTTGFDGDLGRHQEGFPFIGDYIGIGSAGNTVWGAFPDASNGKVTVVAAAKVTLNP